MTRVAGRNTYPGPGPTRYTLVRDVWGDRPTFQLAHGLTMGTCDFSLISPPPLLTLNGDPPDMEKGNAILDELCERERKTTRQEPVPPVPTLPSALRDTRIARSELKHTEAARLPTTSQVIYYAEFDRGDQVTSTSTSTKSPRPSRYADLQSGEFSRYVRDDEQMTRSSHMDEAAYAPQSPYHYSSQRDSVPTTPIRSAGHRLPPAPRPSRGYADSTGVRTPGSIYAELPQAPRKHTPRSTYSELPQGRRTPGATYSDLNVSGPGSRPSSRQSSHARSRTPTIDKGLLQETVDRDTSAPNVTRLTQSARHTWSAARDDYSQVIGNTERRGRHASMPDSSHQEQDRGRNSRSPALRRHNRSRSRGSQAYMPSAHDVDQRSSYREPEQSYLSGTSSSYGRRQFISPPSDLYNSSDSAWTESEDDQRDFVQLSDRFTGMRMEPRPDQRRRSNSSGTDGKRGSLRWQANTVRVYEPDHGYAADESSGYEDGKYFGRTTF